MIYGYKRSMSGQTNYQIYGVGCRKRKLWHPERILTAPVTDTVKQGDTSIDCLGRNYEEIIEQWGFITKKIGADIKVLGRHILLQRHNEYFYFGFGSSDRRNLKESARQKG